MATERQYLAERGLAKLGQRGRFTNDAKKVLATAVAEGVVFDKPVVGAKVEKDGEDGASEDAPSPIKGPRANPVVEQIEQRSDKSLFAVNEIDPTDTMAFAWCDYTNGGCGNHIRWCQCGTGPKPRKGYVLIDLSEDIKNLV